MKPHQLLPHPALSAGLLLLWLALGNGLSAAWALLGALLAVALPLACRRFCLHLPRLRRIFAALELLLIVLGDIVIANLQVARLILGPRAHMQPAFIEVPLDVRDLFVATLLGSIVTLTPGTVAIDVDEQCWTLQVHALNVDDGDALIRSIKTRYETRLKEIFAC